MSTERLTREDLAMDYVLGYAEAEELERAERLMVTDRDFQVDVMMWREKLGEMDRTAPERPAMSLSWDALAQTLDKPSVEPVVNNPAAASAGGLLSSLWLNLDFWRPAALVAGLAAIVLAGGLIRERVKPPGQPVYVAVLQTGDGRAAAVVNAFADGTVTLVPIETIGVPQGRILEVWTLQSREQGPVSVGRMDQARTLRLNLNELRRPDAGHLFEITVEPPGGSPTGRPTGPVLMKGLASTAL